ncbi:response regulator transcription factor [Streptomyces sp. H27-C3]|uniref:response regulator transcription factor n=1 Tax=Streptomyces sp. H27-C3 TaxID=3046305 RepID=UPI0024B9C342|nr:response regulator transcription factor [Streptomyces sp. H27-C3]MDJ0466245.1 response regulator transcription factor [Streptomyces sp. H27-C3]
MSAPSAVPLRILAADDHSLLRGALCELLDLHADLDVVAQADCGGSAVELSASQRPDIVLLDVEMPGSGPVHTIQEILRVAPHARIIMLSMHSDPHLVAAVLDAGAVSYLHKEVERAVLISAIQKAAIGASMTYLPRPSVTRTAPLTPREHELMHYVAQALSNRQIGIQLGIAEGTVKRHLRNVFAKLGATSRLDAANRLRELQQNCGPPRSGQEGPRQPPRPMS